MIDNPAKTSTVVSMSCDARLNEMGIERIWTLDRWKRVANVKGVGPYELASFFGIHHRHVNALEKDNPRLPSEVSMLMSCAEYFVMKRFSKDLILLRVANPEIYSDD